jgi:acyl-CoA hydrolase
VNPAAPLDPELQRALAAIVAHAGPHIIAAAPLGLGKPHRVLNALYSFCAEQPKLRLTLLSALSLSRPRMRGGMEGRFLGPFVQRHFGQDFEDPQWFLAQQRDALPANVDVQEFYLPSGALLGSKQAQQSYASLNYTHAARGIASRHCNVVVQKVARHADGRLSLSSNSDLTQDVIDEVAALGLPRPFLVAEVDPGLPFIEKGASVPAHFFDVVLEHPSPAPALFGVPHQPVSLEEFAIGLYASTLVKDGGTLQIGIGALSDAIAWCLGLRHTRNADYRRMLRALWPEVEQSALVKGTGGLGPFEKGLFGCSEMVMDGFRHLAQLGVLKRRVVHDLAAQERLDAGQGTAEDLAHAEADGEVLHGGFFLGSPALYAWLRDPGADFAKRIRMTRISEINQLGMTEPLLKAAQRRHARFINTTMMQTVLGAGVSDALEDGRVVSGVGGQYNFVAMGHALPDARSILLFRATREAGSTVSSSLLSHYGHTTIPRHLRDVVVSEYGIADLRDRGDGDCIRAMLAIGDARFTPALTQAAQSSGKLGKIDPESWMRNTPARLASVLMPFRAEGLLPEYPLGSDFTAEEQDLVRALGVLKSATSTRSGKLQAILGAVLRSESGADAREIAALARMGYDSSTTWRDALERRLLRQALRDTRPV